MVPAFPAAPFGETYSEPVAGGGVVVGATVAVAVGAAVGVADGAGVELAVAVGATVEVAVGEGVGVVKSAVETTTLSNLAAVL